MSAFSAVVLTAGVVNATGSHNTNKFKQTEDCNVRTLKSESCNEDECKQDRRRPKHDSCNEDECQTAVESKHRSDDCEQVPEEVPEETPEVTPVPEPTPAPVVTPTPAPVVDNTPIIGK